jgi:hypothetical protein
MGRFRESKSGNAENKHGSLPISCSYCFAFMVSLPCVKQLIVKVKLPGTSQVQKLEKKILSVTFT